MVMENLTYFSHQQHELTDYADPPIDLNPTGPNHTDNGYTQCTNDRWFTNRKPQLSQLSLLQCDGALHHSFLGGTCGKLSLNEGDQVQLFTPKQAGKFTESARAIHEFQGGT